MLLVLNVHPSRRADLLSDDVVRFDPPLEMWGYIDGFGNACSRVVMPAGRTTVSTEFEIYDAGLPDVVPRDAVQHEIKDLPDEVLVFLLGSRYCDTDRLGDFAWSTFGQTPPGWSRVQAICDFVHGHIVFNYANADPLQDRLWRLRRPHRCLSRLRASRDHALSVHEHSGALLHRIPGRHRGSPDPNPMDFSGWFEAYLGGHWYTFDARHNTPRIGRILMATGRDATDVAISTSFGSSKLVHFEVITEEVVNDDGVAVQLRGP
jgi:transglutaminase-like putative cysteine protease